MKSSHNLIIVVIAGLSCLWTPSSAQAYLDPSTGGMVVTALVGIFASIALAMKTYWYRIKAFFKRGKAKDSNAEPGSES